MATISSDSRVGQAFTEARRQARPALVGYLTAGHPDPATSVEALSRLSTVVDLLEIGVPFSDPVADGPVIQRSSQLALEAGVGLPRVLDMLAGCALSCPVVLFSYFNPILAYGVDRLQRDAAAAGARAILIVDLPGASDDPAEEVLRQGPLDLVPLVAPTTSAERVALLAGRAQGFLYLVGRLGVTGVSANISGELEATVARVCGVSPVPVAVGFGIGTAEHARRVGSLADGVVVGSALVERLERDGVGGMLGLARELRDSLEGLVTEGNR